MNLKGRTVLLTGASGGIGRAAALRLARRGARVALFARHPDPLRALAKEIENAGGEALAVPGDVCSTIDALRAVVETTSRFGRIDALVNNAGVGYLRAVDEATDDEIEEQLAVNLRGAIRMTRAALTALKARRGSAIVNVASFAGRVAAPYYSYYNASKFGLVGLTEGWRRELRPLGIRVSLLIPAAVETQFLDRAGRERALGIGPAGTILDTDQVALGIERALRHHSAEIYIPARNQWLAVLNVAAPALSDRIVNALFRYPRRS
ncbi:MAG TPA: SDR family NAD(P)-dependent oxidoreductase [Candidatus Dormibacteraeota bacterium]|nr:SDR family NAD(P)-dependent oxidoreductase [Candidatus Dormibacteraeota bacterium]